MNNPQTTANNRGNQVKFSQDRVAHIEKHFGSFCEVLGSVTRKYGRIRDKGDLFCHLLASYAQSEKLNNSSRNCLLRFAENYSTIQDYRQSEIQRLNEKVLKPLSQYGTRCKEMKSMVKAEKKAQAKVIKSHQHLTKLQQKNMADQHRLQQAETELTRANNDARVFSKQLESEMNRFEQEKLMDLKRVLKEFVSVELIFHAKAVEFLTKCYQNITEINEDADFMEFRAALLELSGMSKGQIAEMVAVERDQAETSYSPDTITYSATSLRHPTVHAASPMYGEEDDDDDEEDEEEDE